MICWLWFEPTMRTLFGFLELRCMFSMFLLGSKTWHAPFFLLGHSKACINSQMSELLYVWAMRQQVMFVTLPFVKGIQAILPKP